MDQLGRSGSLCFRRNDRRHGLPTYSPLPSGGEGRGEKGDSAGRAEKFKLAGNAADSFIGERIPSGASVSRQDRRARQRAGVPVGEAAIRSWVMQIGVWAGGLLG